MDQQHMYQQHTAELSRINVDNTKTIANTARETVARFC
jgi:hypothetical protein